MSWRACSLGGRGGAVGDFPLELFHLLLELGPFGQEFLVTIVHGLLRGKKKKKHGAQARRRINKRGKGAPP